MRTHRALATVTAVALTTATLTGCAATSPEPTTPTVEAAERTPEPTEEPVVEESPEPEPTEDVLPEYTLADGTSVTINPADPLPEAVVSDIRSRSGVQGTAAPATGADNVARGNAIVAAQDEVKRLGRVPVVVMRGGVYDLNGNLERENVYVVIPEGDPIHSTDVIFPDAATAVQVARDRIATSGNPAQYALIDLT